MLIQVEVVDEAQKMAIEMVLKNRKRQIDHGGLNVFPGDKSAEQLAQEGANVLALLEARVVETFPEKRP